MIQAVAVVVLLLFVLFAGAFVLWVYFSAQSEEKVVGTETDWFDPDEDDEYWPPTATV